MSIYEFISYRDFLSAWFEEKKTSNPNFSHRMFSRLMGQKSPSFLKDIVQKRRNLTPDQQSKLIKIIKLSAAEKRYLNDMIILDHSEDSKERNHAFERIAAARRLNGAQKLDGEGYRYLSRWYCPAIRELSHRKDFSPTVEWITEHLRPQISRKQAKEALQILEDLGMLEIKPDGSHQFYEKSITTPLQVSGLAVHNYHQEMLQLAKEGVHRFDPDDRHYMALTVCISDEAIPKLKAELNNMAARLLDLCDSAKEEPDQAIQVQLHFFPLSDSLNQDK